jgi:hypothetical protein
VTWFRVDDSFPTHPKVVKIPRKIRPQALALWLTAGCYSAHYLTDGFVSAEDVEEFGFSRPVAQALVEARLRPDEPGLWLPVDGGYQFHDWQTYQPTRAKVEAERENTRKRVQQHRERKRNRGGNDDDTTM